MRDELNTSRESIKKLSTSNVERLDSMQANKVGQVADNRSNLLISENSGSKDQTAGEFITTIQEEGDSQSERLSSDDD